MYEHPSPVFYGIRSTWYSNDLCGKSSCTRCRDLELEALKIYFQKNLYIPLPGPQICTQFTSTMEHNQAQVFLKSPVALEPLGCMS